MRCECDNRNSPHCPKCRRDAEKKRTADMRTVLSVLVHSYDIVTAAGRPLTDMPIAEHVAAARNVLVR